MGKMYYPCISNICPMFNRTKNSKKKKHPLSVIDAKILWDPPANNIAMDLLFHIESKS